MRCLLLMEENNAYHWNHTEMRSNFSEICPETVGDRDFIDISSPNSNPCKCHREKIIWLIRIYVFMHSHSAGL